MIERGARHSIDTNQSWDVMRRLVLATHRQGGALQEPDLFEWNRDGNLFVRFGGIFSQNQFPLLRITLQQFLIIKESGRTPAQSLRGCSINAQMAPAIPLVERTCLANTIDFIGGAREARTPDLSSAIAHGGIVTHYKSIT